MTSDKNTHNKKLPQGLSVTVKFKTTGLKIIFAATSAFCLLYIGILAMEFYDSILNIK